MNLWERAKATIRECADDMECEVNQAYPDRDRYPDYQRKWERDMAGVLAVHRVLAEMERVECVEYHEGERFAFTGRCPALLLLLETDR